MTKSEARSILGVESDATDAEIKQAYRRLVLIVHPDRGGSSADFIPVNEAYQILTGTKAASSRPESAPAPGGSSSRPTARPQHTYRVATVAMRLLNLDPEEFARIELICHQWLGDVSSLNRRAAKQLFWLAAGRIPVGAAASVMQGQRFKSAAKAMLAALADVSNRMDSPEAWLNFATRYMQMLKLSGMKSVSKEFSRAEFQAALTRAQETEGRPSGRY